MCLEQQRQMLDELRGIRKALEAMVPDRISVQQVQIPPQRRFSELDIGELERRVGRVILDSDDAARYVDGLPAGEPPEDAYDDDPEA